MEELIFFEVKDNIITNACVFYDEETPKSMGFLPAIEDKWIGDRYDDTLTNEELMAQNKLLEAQINATSERQEFLEDVMAEFMITVLSDM